MIKIDMEMPQMCYYCPICVDDMCVIRNKLMEWGDRLPDCLLIEDSEQEGE